jgi:uracil-DNA glycosylase
MAARSLNVLRAEARSCRNCPLWERATQTVFGEGAAHATILLVGEQPGDQEDRQGRPFVGPAGHLLETALDRAGIDRKATYVTNAVKHFKWVAQEGRGKRRIHQKPNTTEVRACQPWLLGEIEAVAPRVIVALGATAAQSLLGSAFRVTQHRGKPVASPYGPPIVATVHPASILRGDPEQREADLALFIRDLEAARLVAAEATSSPARRGSSSPPARGARAPAANR